jgi:hypothetical protein
LAVKDNLKFKTYSSQQVPLEKLLRFLESNYLTISYTKEYLEWFFSRESSLCAKEDDQGNFIAVAMASVFSLIFTNKECSVLHAGPVCVKKEFRKKALLLPFLAEVEDYKNNTYSYPSFANALDRFKANPSPTQKILFHNFGIFAVDTESLKKPKEKIFCALNMHLKKSEGYLFDFYENKQGWTAVHYQDVKHRGISERLGVVVSYSTTGSWNSLVYEAAKEKYLNHCDKVVVFENYERKGSFLEDMGFEKMLNYSLFHDTMDKKFLYYNFFLY